VREIELAALSLDNPAAAIPTVSGRPDLDALLRAVPASRMVDYGLPPALAGTYRAAVERGAEWVTVGQQLAAIVGHNVETTEQGGLAGLSAHQRLSAALLRCVAQLGYEDDRSGRVALYRQAIEDFAAAAVALDYDRIEVEVGSRWVTAWLGLPADGRPAPVALIWGGTSGWGPVYHRMAGRLRAAGIGVALVELPGQGEPRLFHGSVLDRDFTTVVSALIDVISDRADGVGSFGVVGHSMGGLLAARAAIADPRLQACVVNGGVARPRELVEHFPRQRQQWQLLLGATSDTTLFDALDELALDPVRDRLRCPALVIHGGADRLVTATDVAAFGVAAPHAGSLIVRFRDGEHCIYNRADERDELIAEFLIRQLRPDEKVGTGPTATVRE
jgi:pimeloyl-ACP methyl ester carboxylesterase